MDKSVKGLVKQIKMGNPYQDAYTAKYLNGEELLTVLTERSEAD